MGGLDRRVLLLLLLYGIESTPKDGRIVGRCSRSPPGGYSATTALRSGRWRETEAPLSVPSSLRRRPLVGKSIMPSHSLRGRCKRVQCAICVVLRCFGVAGRAENENCHVHYRSGSPRFRAEIIVPCPFGAYTYVTDEETRIFIWIYNSFTTRFAFTWNR